MALSASLPGPAYDQGSRRSQVEIDCHREKIGSIFLLLSSCPVPIPLLHKLISLVNLEVDLV
jgi:hypothetical protein